ncbi:hypothetical protein [Chryseobacterium soli]|uniref:hypothetical protein n=1 Tax=Chryseobacterium soli TaxID=445961 RepID=UPI001E55B713|nr:hypothetical protein [Chryseobacterium soli]
MRFCGYLHYFIFVIISLETPSTLAPIATVTPQYAREKAEHEEYEWIAGLSFHTPFCSCEFSTYWKYGMFCSTFALRFKTLFMEGMMKLEIKKNIQKEEDKNLSFRVFDLNTDNLETYFQPHKKDHFFILVIESGKIRIHIEEKIHLLTPGKFPWYFLNRFILYRIPVQI